MHTKEVYTIKVGNQLKGGNENVESGGVMLTNKKNKVVRSIVY